LSLIEQIAATAYRARMPARPTIVLTGFGPFPGVPDNATATLVPRLTKAAGTLFASHDVVGEILPTEWRSAPARLETLIGLGNVVLMLHFGVAQDAHGFRLELVSRNMQTSLQDAAGELPDSGEVIEEGPELLAATLPAERIAARLLGLGYPCATSDNAGTYLCNALLYHSLTAARELPAPHLIGFIHLPAGLTGHGPGGLDRHPNCPLDWRGAVAGGLEIIGACLDHIAERGPPVKTG
jgi:pyroglutamyl-peptidase